MRIVPLTLAIICVACSSSTGVDNKAKPGPSMAGLWHAADTSQHYMTLRLSQTAGTVSGDGWVDLTQNNAIDSTDTLTVQGQNVIWPPCCQDSFCPPCALVFPVSLTLFDTKGQRLLVSGAFAPGDTNQFIVQVFGESPGFPFLFQTQPALLLAFTRQQQTIQ